MKSTNLLLGVVALFLLFLATAAFLFAFEGGSSARTGNALEYDNKQLYSVTNYDVKYVYQAINVRKGPGTNFPVVTQLKRGDSVRVVREENEWSEVRIKGYANTYYIYSPLLHNTPLPEIEISSWNWYKDPDYGLNGAVVWNVRVNNNTNEYIEYVLVEFSTYDANDELITSATTYVEGLPPGGYGVAKSFATYFGTEKHARIRIVTHQ